MDPKAPSLEQHCHSRVEFSAVMDLLYAVPSRAAATRHMWPVSTCNSAREESNFSFYFILINLNLNSFIWLVEIVLNSTALKYVS